MSSSGTSMDSAVVAAIRAGGDPAFTDAVERHRRELHVHCYRMLGSLEDAEDAVQDTFLRAWRSRSSFEGRSTFRAWLYRIATNASLDLLARRPRSPVAVDGVGGQWRRRAARGGALLAATVSGSIARSECAR